MVPVAPPEQQRHRTESTDMNNNKALLEERHRLNENLQEILKSLQRIDTELDAQVPSLRVSCGFERTSRSAQLAWLCLELQLQPADRVILLEELLSRGASIEQFLIALQHSPTPTIPAALATLSSQGSSPGSGRISEPWKN